MKRAHPEQDLHKAVAAYLRVALRPPTIWTTIGHGGGGKTRGGILKGMGVQPGWPDILIVHPAYNDTWLERNASLLPFLIGIELKAKRGSQSAEQKYMQAAFVAAGGCYVLARSVDQVEIALRNLRLPVFSTVLARIAA
jgi:hypothetical protein